MPRHPLDPAFAKIKRAKTHIADLERAIEAFVERDPYRLVSEVNAEGTEEVWRIEIDCIDEEIEAIAADAVHNLRMPLDKMLTVGASEKSLRQIKFPTGKRKEEFERSLANQEKHLSGAIIDFLQATEAYPRGKGELLFALHDIDNGDKHHPLVVPINLGKTAINVAAIHDQTRGLVMIGSKQGAHMVPVPNPKTGSRDLLAPSDEARPILREIGGQAWLEFWGPHHNMEVFTTTPGAKVDIKIKPTLNVAFSEVEGFESEPVVAVLHQMCHAVEGTLITFRDRFF
jgi:hypothetical protein